MTSFTVKISPGTWPREAAALIHEGRVAQDGDRIVAEAATFKAEDENAQFYAVQRGDQVTARLVEWQLESADRLRVFYHEEARGFPEGRLMPPAVFLALTPSSDPTILAQRDRIRADLGKTDFLANLIVATKADTQAGRASGQAPARELKRDITPERSQPQPNDGIQTPDNDGAETPAKRAQDKTRIRILVDRAPSALVAQASGAKFLRFTGFGIDGIKGFLKVFVWTGAEKAAETIAAAIAQKGAASLEIDGTASGTGRDRQFKVSSLLSVTPTDERIQTRSKSDDRDRQPDQAPEREHTTPAIERPRADNERAL